MSDGKTASRHVIEAGLSEKERRAWIAGWREHSDPADIERFARAQNALYIEAQQLMEAGLTPTSPEAQSLAERWMRLLQQHSLASGVMRVQQRNPSLTPRVIKNAKKLWDKSPQKSDGVIPPGARFLNDARRIRMEKGGLEDLHADMRRLIDDSSNPASPEAQRVVERYLKFCEVQFISDPASFCAIAIPIPQPRARRRRCA
jgi:TipAS antibiotic-recognition domain